MGQTRTDTLQVGGGYGSTGASIAEDGDIQTNGDLTVDGAATTGALTAASAAIGGGYGSTGTTLDASGNVQANGALTVDGAATVGALTAASAAIGGGYGSTGSTLDASGNLQINGNATIDGTLNGKTIANIVTGPASATDNALARFDLTTGKILQNSVVTVADSTGNMAGVGTLACGAITSTGAFSNSGSSLTTNAITCTGVVVGSSGATARIIQMWTADGANRMIRFQSGSGPTVDAEIRVEGATDDFAIRTGGTERFRIANGGELQIPGSPTIGATGSTPSIGDREYTPTGTAVTNCDGTANGKGRWIRVGNRVFVSGIILIDPTAAGACVARVTLPVASAFTASADLHGQGTNVNGVIANIVGDAANDQAQFIFTAPSGIAIPFHFNFSYTVK